MSRPGILSCLGSRYKARIALVLMSRARVTHVFGASALKQHRGLKSETPKKQI